jgi:hypothetical protein
MFLAALWLVFFKVCELHTLTLQGYITESVWTSPMATNTSRKLLDRSCRWIRDHWNANNLDVPDEFLHQWIYNQQDENVEATGFYLAVFSFGYMQHELISKNVPDGVRRSVTSARLIELFQRWQLKLALVELHRVTHLRFLPMALFDFPADETVEAWKEDAGSKVQAS